MQLTIPRTIAPPSASTGCSTYSNSVAGQTAGNGYPPYNIEKAGENAYRIVMAVAGFAEAELDVTQKENELLVSGQAAPKGEDETQFLYRGIAGRNFDAASSSPTM